MVTGAAVETPMAHVAPSGAIAVLSTTEMRWFFAGALPDAVLSWFTHDQSLGLREARTDDYHLVDDDTGLKLRLGHTLELKCRRGKPALTEIVPGAWGCQERWTRWSPASFLSMPSEPAWHAVDKVVVKRRFAFCGTEIPLTPANLPQQGAGCDVEITSVELNATPGWALAFAAFGPEDEQGSSLAAAARTLLTDDPAMPRFQLGLQGSCGYPEWLASVLGD